MGTPFVESGRNTATSTVFFALSDPTRQALIDQLCARDGQRLCELAHRYSMSRQAVAKHLETLEEAGLVRSQSQRSEKRFFLDLAPIRLIHEEWGRRYVVAAPGGPVVPVQAS